MFDNGKDRIRVADVLDVVQQVFAFAEWKYRVSPAWQPTSRVVPSWVCWLLRPALIAWPII
jgi:hypothetical protein